MKTLGVILQGRFTVRGKYWNVMEFYQEAMDSSNAKVHFWDPKYFQRAVYMLLGENYGKRINQSLACYSAIPQLCSWRIICIMQLELCYNVHV